MRIQIIKYDRYLATQLGVKLWSIWDAEMEIKKGKSKCVSYEYRQFYIKTFPKYPCNTPPDGCRTLIKEDECVIINDTK